MEEKRFYAIQQQGRTAELVIFGPIRTVRWEENDVTAYNIVRELRALDADEIHVHVNCPGGSVGEAFAIYNVLREHPAKVTTYADGYVASAAIYPFLAGERRIANPVSAFYFHPVQMEAYGGPDKLRKAVDQAELLTEQGIKAFEAAGISTETARELVERDDFATPEEMVKLGVATELGQKERAEDASQSILPMVAKLVREHRQRKQAEREGSEDLTNGQETKQEAFQGCDMAENGQEFTRVIVQARARATLTKEEAAGELREAFGAMFQDLVQGTPREGAGSPVGMVNDPDLREDRGSGETKSNRLRAWLGLQAAE